MLPGQLVHTLPAAAGETGAQALGLHMPALLESDSNPDRKSNQSSDDSSVITQWSFKLFSRAWQEWWHHLCTSWAQCMDLALEDGAQVEPDPFLQEHTKKAPK